MQQLEQQSNNLVVTAENEQYIFQEDNGIYNVYITKPIGAPSKFTALFELLRTASEHDTINFFLNTPGGRLDTTVQLIHSMENTAAETVGHVISQVASAGTMITLSCDNLAVYPHGYMMLHNAAGGAGYDKINLTAQAAVHSAEWCGRIADDIYKYFLTDEEIELLKRNNDFYFSAEEIMERWERVLEAREAAVSAMQEEQESQQISAVEKALDSVKEKIKREILEELKAK